MKKAKMEATNNKTLRKCVVSGELLPKEEMLRFVISPDCVVVPDLCMELPGRGIWVTANKSFVENAVEKNMFSRSAKQKVNVPKDLADKIENQLKQKCLSLLGMACKSGLVVAGFEKAKHALMQSSNDVLFFAKDGAINSFKKIRSAAKDTKVISDFTAEEMGAVIGRETAVHVVVKQGKIAKKLCDEAERFRDYTKSTV
ncbi:MAG: RNA-binding protein [Alphaproteobacteria bacterium]|nr:RNA-binding protein [Alphaproteobacteria bacterium]